jgi:hypothetical protein
MCEEDSLSTKNKITRYTQRFQSKLKQFAENRRFPSLQSQSKELRDGLRQEVRQS